MSILTERCNRFHKKALTVFNSEEILSRMNKLAGFYHQGEEYGEGTSLRTAVNKVRPRVHLAVSSMFAKRPEMIAKPTRAEFGKAAEKGQALGNYLIRQKRQSKELRQVLTHARLFHYGAVLTGMGSGNPRLPFVKCVDPRSVLVDTTHERFDPDEDSWQFRRYRRTFSKLRASGIYSERKLNAAASFLYDHFDKKERKFEEDTLAVWIGEHYIRERVEGKPGILVATSIMGTAGDDFDRYAGAEFFEEPSEALWIREEDYTPVGGMPIKFLYFIPSPHSFYPQSPVELWLPQQEEFNEFRTQKLIEAHRGTRKILLKEGAFTPEEIEKFKINEPLVAIKVSEGNLADAVAPCPLGDIPSETFQGEADTEMSIQEIDGTGSAQLGTEPKRGSPSATREALIDQNLRLRMSDQQETWLEFLEEVYGQAIIPLAKNHMKGEVLTQITGTDATSDVVIDKLGLQGDYEVTFDFMSMMPRDREKEKTEALEEWQMFSPRPDLVNPQWLVRHVMKKRDIKDVDEATRVQPLPMGMPGAGGQRPGQPQGQPQSTGIGAAVMQEAAQMGAQGGAPPSSMPGFGGRM